MPGPSCFETSHYGHSCSIMFGENIRSFDRGLPSQDLPGLHSAALPAAADAGLPAAGSAGGGRRTQREGPQVHGLPPSRRPGCRYSSTAAKVARRPSISGVCRFFFWSWGAMAPQKKLKPSLARKGRMLRLWPCASCKLLVGFGVTLHWVDEYQQTALYYAARRGHTKTCAYLLQQGVNVNHLDSNGEAALFYAATRALVDTALILIEG